MQTYVRLSLLFSLEGTVRDQDREAAGNGGFEQQPEQEPADEREDHHGTTVQQPLLPPIPRVRPAGQLQLPHHDLSRT